jgi:MscS family membrane protein
MADERPGSGKVSGQGADPRLLTHDPPPVVPRAARHHGTSRDMTPLILTIRQAFSVALAVLLFLWLAVAVSAQTTPLSAPDKSSPQDWMTSFLAEADRFEQAYTAYRQDHTRANVRALTQQVDVLRGFFDLSEFPPAFHDKIGGEAATYLIDILNRLPQDAILSGPGDPTGTNTIPDHWVIPETEIALVRKDSGEASEVYLIPPEIIRRLTGFHEKIIAAPLQRETAYPEMSEVLMQATGPLIPNALVDRIPRPLKVTFFETPIWKQLVAGAVLVFVIWLNIAWLRAVNRRLAHLSEAVEGLARLSGPAFLAGSFVLFYIFVAIELNVQGSVALLTLLIRDVAMIAAGAWLAWSLTMICTELAIGSERAPEEQLHAHLTRLIGKIIGFVAVSASVIFGLSRLGIPAAGLITSLGVGGVGVALAARATLENLIGGLVLLMDRPFTVGDTIESASGNGKIVDVGPRSSRLTTADGRTIAIPNGVLSDAPITNLGTSRPYRLTQLIALPPDIGPDAAKEQLVALRQRLAALPALPSDGLETGVRLTLSADNKAGIELDLAVPAGSPAEFESIRTDVLLCLLDMAQTAASGDARLHG